MILRLLWLLSLAAALFAQSSSIQRDESPSLKGHIYYYEDAAGTLSWQEASQKSFQCYPKERINFGFTSSVFWFKINVSTIVQNDSVQRWLMIAYPLLNEIDLYHLDGNGHLIEYKRLGTSVARQDREYPMRNFLTDLALEKDSHSTLLLRVKTQSSMQVPLSISTTAQILSDVESGNLRIGIYYGIFLIIFLYNALIFMYTKDSNYLRYILFLTTFVAWQLSFDGIGREYLWQNYYGDIEQISAALISFSGFSALYFSRNFLTTASYLPKVDRFIKLLMVLSFTLSIVALIVPYSAIIMYNTALVSLIPMVLLATGIVIMRQGYRPARFYVVGWSSFFIGTIIFALNKFDLITGFYGVNHVQQIGSAVEMIFLSWALADRVHLLQGEYIDKLNRLNETLSEKVRDALSEAREKDRLIVQQSRLAAMGEMIEQIAHQWRQPLNTLALLNQHHYVNYKLGKCDDACFDKTHEQIDEHLQYMSKTIDDFRNYYKTDKTKELEDVASLVQDALRLSEVFLKYAKIKIRLDLRPTTQVVLAKNEMIQVLMNLIKNAHDALVEQKIANGTISIGVEEIEHHIHIFVEDNAGGIDPYLIAKIFDIYFTTKDPEKGSGLGLHMSKSIIEESFGGTISVQNIPGGARFIIIIPIDQDES
ncbi:sensor histidine kinase [Sulfuricurvum sp.]|uniref:sensor histidine kinase n=1 Tax=Sulfuricurvum sp. TaxID=2025608 RepID=UPI003C39F723